MLRRVALVRTNVAEELSASFIRVTRIRELGSNRRTLLVFLHSLRRSHYNGSVVTRALVWLIAAKCKLLEFFEYEFALSNIADICHIEIQ
jgi:hypothetical protein